MPNPTLLAYNLSGERLSKIRLLAMRYSIRFRPVKPEEYGQPVGALCGLAEALETPPETAAFADEMLVMAFFPGGLTNKFLDAFRQQHLPSVKLKAMLTDTNSRWTSGQLHKELSEEAEYFAKMKTGLHEKQAADAAGEASI